MTEKRARRCFSAQFKADAVRLVLEQGLPMTRVARDLDLAESALRRWVDKARERGAEALTRIALTLEQHDRGLKK